MRPNHVNLFYVSYSLELPDRVEGYSDNDVPVFRTCFITNIADFLLMVVACISRGYRNMLFQWPPDGNIEYRYHELVYQYWYNTLNDSTGEKGKSLAKIKMHPTRYI